VGPYEVRGVPAQETRGGDRVNWAQARPGEPLPELPPEDYPEPDSKQLELPFDEPLPELPPRLYWGQDEV
jgi:hypothetical protein